MFISYALVCASWVWVSSNWIRNAEENQFKFIFLVKLIISTWKLITRYPTNTVHTLFVHPYECIRKKKKSLQSGWNGKRNALGQWSVWPHALFNVWLCEIYCGIFISNDSLIVLKSLQKENGQCNCSGHKKKRRSQIEFFVLRLRDWKSSARTFINTTNPMICTPYFGLSRLRAQRARTNKLCWMVYSCGPGYIVWTIANWN